MKFEEMIRIVTWKNLLHLTSSAPSFSISTQMFRAFQILFVFQMNFAKIAK